MVSPRSLFSPDCPSSEDDLRNSAVARLAVPDTNRVTLDSGLSAEGAGVLGVLGNFHLLDGLSERGTVSLIMHVSSCLIYNRHLWPWCAVLRCVPDFAINSLVVEVKRMVGSEPSAFGTN